MRPRNVAAGTHEPAASLRFHCVAPHWNEFPSMIRVRGLLLLRWREFFAAFGPYAVGTVETPTTSTPAKPNTGRTGLAGPIPLFTCIHDPILAMMVMSLSSFIDEAMTAHFR